jgi:hypothetical protein
LPERLTFGIAIQAGVLVGQPGCVTTPTHASGPMRRVDGKALAQDKHKKRHSFAGKVNVEMLKSRLFEWGARDQCSKIAK